MKLWSILGCCALGVVSLFAVGCGGDDDEQPAAQQATVNEQAAKSSASSSIAAVKPIATSSDGLATSGPGAAFALVGAASGMLSSIQPTSGQGAAAFRLPYQASPIKSIHQAVQSGTCDCTETACNFENCTDSSAGFSYKLNGSIAYENGHMTCTDFSFEMSLDGSSSGGGTFTAVYNLDCDVTLTETSIDGNLHLSGEMESNYGGQAANATYDVSVDYNDVTWDANGTPTGGSVDVSASMSYNGQNYSADGSVSFP